MAKRILSWVLSMALLLGCVSGLTLISSAGNVVKASNLVPETYDGGQGAFFKGTFDGFNVFGWQKGGWMSWNNAKIANALGVPAEEANVSISFDYYWEDVESKDGGTWWEIKTTTADGGENKALTHWAFAEEDNMVKNQWAEHTITRTAVLGMGGKDDMFINVGELNNSKLYIRGMKVVATVGEDTYTALWGSYLTAKIDFSNPETGATVKGASSLNAVNNGNIDVVQIPGTDMYGVKMNVHNGGYSFRLADLGIGNQEVAISVEYFIESATAGDNSRFNFRIEGAQEVEIDGVKYPKVSHIMRYKGWNNNNVDGGYIVNPNTDLTADKLAMYTFTVSGQEAEAMFTHDCVAMFWGGNDGQDSYYIRSISIMPASMLAAAPVDPGYKFYDNVATYAQNPFYPQYNIPLSYGMGVKLGDNGTMAYYDVTSDKSDVMIKFIMKEGAERTQLNIDYQTKSLEEVPDGWRGTNGVTAEVIDGVATYVFEDAVFQNGLNGLGSFRLGLDQVADIARVEVYTATDMTALNEAIAAAKAADTTGKTEASIAKLNAAIAAAETVAANVWSTAGDVAAAKDALAAAEAGLKNIREVGYGSTFGHVEFDHFEGEYKDEGQNIGFTDQGEWFEYEVNVKEAGLYNIDVDMGTGNADSTIEVQDGNGNVYGSFVVPSKGWGQYETFTVTANLAAGVQKIRILYKQSSANYYGLTLSDARYTLTGATVEMNANGNNSGSIVKKEGKYAWYMGHNQYLAIKPTDAAQFANVENVILEATVWIPANEDYQTGLPTGEWATNRRFLSGFSGYSGSTMTNATRFTTGEWATVTWTTAESFGDDTEKNLNGVKAGNKAEVWFFDENCKVDEAFGGAYISKIKVYDAANADNYIEIAFADTVKKDDLQALVNEQIDLDLYSAATVKAYTDAIAAAQAVLADEAADQETVDAALVNLQAAKAALADKRYTLNNATTDMNPNSTVLADGIITLGDNQYAWVVGGTPENKVGNKWIGIGDPNGILANSTSVTYEYDIMFDSAANLNARVFLAYGKKGAGWIDVRDNGDDFNGFAAHGNWLPGNMVGTAPANGEWGTIAIKNDNYDPTIQVNGCITRLGFWAEETNIYVKAIRAYDSEDPTKMISLTFSKVPGKDDLQAALDNAVNTDSYTAASVEAYNAALAAIEALLAQDEVTEQEVVDALAALKAAEAALAPAHSNMTFENDEIHNVNSNITHNHPDEDDEGNGIFEIYEGAGIYGIKLSRQNRGFGYAVQNAADWLIEGEPVQITVTYYAPSAAIQDNSRMGFLFEGDSWYRIRFGANADFAASGLVADEVSSFTITLSEADAAKVLANGSFNIYFWNHNDNDQTGGDYIYLTEIRVHNPLPANKEDLQAAVDAAIEDLSSYTAASAEAYAAAVEAAKAVLANEEATAADIEKAMADLMAAEAALEKQTYDVIVVDISTTAGDTPKVGDKVFFTFTVKNNGDATIPAGSKFGGIVKIGDTMIGWSDNYKGADQAPALAPGETLVLTLCGGPDGSDGSWTVTAEAVEVFAQVNDNPGDGIYEVGAALENNTYTETITSTTLDFAALNAAIADEVTDLTPYTEDSAAAYTAALEAAKALAGKLDATQEAIDAAVKALTDAKAALTEKKPEPTAEAGDVDGDGKITSTDARLVLQLYAKKITEAELNASVADVDGDGEITSTDARLILQVYAKKIPAFPTVEA